MKARKIYLASSWRNSDQPFVLEILREAGHSVYNFRNPEPGNTGIAWAEIDPAWMNWSPSNFVTSLQSPIATGGYQFDKNGLDWCDTCVLLLPCGRSAHLEAGYAIGQGKPTLIVCAAKNFEPELMYLLADEVVPDSSHVLSALEDMRYYTGKKGVCYATVQQPSA